MEVTKKFIDEESKEPEHKGTKIAASVKGSPKAAFRNKMAKMFMKKKSTK